MRAMDGPKAPYTATRLTDWEESEERDVVHLAEWKQIFQQADQDRCVDSAFVPDSEYCIDLDLNGEV